jgi:DNA helicase-2/ATP-dependent DNA helicase PcrA
MPRSPQQEAVVQWVSNGQGNAFVTAVAGAGKTTTLIDCIEIAAQNPKNSIAYAAFNKAIAQEVQGKLEARGLMSRNVKVGTFHSFGYSAWRRAHPNVKLEDTLPKDERKWTIIEQSMKEKLFETDGSAGDQLLKKIWPAARKLVGYAKADAMHPEQISDMSKWHGYAEHYSVADDMEDPGLLHRAINMARVALIKSIKMADKIVDFDDMLYMPVISGVKIWENNWLLVDEAQDTNPVRLQLARRMVSQRYGRAIFVGDPRQAIYGFSGADARAVDKIITDFRCAELPLTVTFRCPKAIVKAAQRYVSHIEAAPSAPQGLVDHMTQDELEEAAKQNLLRPTDAILCRKTAPLVELAYMMLGKGVACHVEGRDIGQGLKALLKRWKVQNVERFLVKLDDWAETNANKKIAKGDELGAEAVRDQAASLKVICAGCHTLKEVEDKIDGLFADGDTNNITLSTVHRSKGREWPRVFVLGENRWMPLQAARKDWEVEQEYNLIYVAYTRAQQELFLVSVPFDNE